MSDTKMEVANVMVALGGDMFNTVPKPRVTAAEIAVLQKIHGDDAVHEVQRVGRIARPQRVELARLKHIYGKATDGNNKPIVESMFPGEAARVFERLNELRLHDAQFKAVRIGVGLDARAADAARDQDKALTITDDMLEPIVDTDIDMSQSPVPEEFDDGLDELPADDLPMAPQPNAFD